MSKVHLFVSVLASIYITACTSVPQVTATLPLIGQDNKGESHGEPVPEALSNRLERAYSGESFSTLYGDVSIERTYISAMGNKCHIFNLVSNSQSQADSDSLRPQFYGSDRRACNRAGEWVLITPLMKQSYMGGQ